MMQVKRVSKRKLAANAAGAVVGLSLAAAGLLRAAEAPAEHCAMRQRRAETGCVEQGNTGSFEVERLELPTAASCAERLRLWLWNLPQVVRALVLLPAWCIGESAVWTFRLIGAGLSPILSMLGSALLEALLLFGLFALLYKLLFPYAKLGMLFQKKRWLYLLLCAGVLTLADRLLRQYTEGYAAIRAAAGIVLGFLTLLLLWNRLFRGHAAPARTEKWIALPRAA